MVLSGRFWVLVLVLVGSLPANEVCSEEVEAHLREYEGRWVGEFSISSVATGYSETFEVEQQYWWDDGRLHGVAVMQRKRGLESARSVCAVEGGSLVSEIEGPGGKERFVGEMHEGGIVWLSNEKERITDYQVVEKFLEEGGQRLLVTEGFDTFEYKGAPAEVVYRGRLVKVQQ